MRRVEEKRLVNPRKVLLGGIAGGILGCVFIILAIQSNIQAMGSTGELQSGYSEALAIFGLLSGGFVAGYLASRNEKETLGYAVSASVVSGALVSLFLVGLTIFTGGDSLAVVLQEMGLENYLLFIIVFAVLLTAISSIGGVVCALILGTKDSIITKSFKDSIKRYRLGLIVPLIVFLSLGLLIQVLPALNPQGNTESNLLLYATDLVAMIVVIVFISLGYNVAINSVKKVKGVKQTFTEAVDKSTSVLLSLFLMWFVTPMILFSILMLGLNAVLESLGSIELLLTITLGIMSITMIYMLFVSFTPQAVRSKGKVIEGIKKGISFVWKNFFMVISLYTLLFLILSTITILFGVMMLLTGQGETIAGVVILSLAQLLVLVFAIEAQTMLYFNLTKGGVK